MSKKKLLVVDDDAVVRITLSTKLKANGFEVITATDGAEAVAAVRTQGPDLILLDITFPAYLGEVAWDGFLIMEWLKRLEEATNVPIVAISSGSPEACERRAIEAGAIAFFPKPIDHDKLFGLIRLTLNLQPASA